MNRISHQNSAEPSTRSNASVVTQPNARQPTVTQPNRKPDRNSSQIASDRTEASTASLMTEQDGVLREEAFCEIQQGNYEAAIALLNVLLERHPDSASSVNDYNNRGLLYFQIGQLPAALADYNQALQLNPNLAKIYNNRANCCAAMGRSMEALFDYEIALDLNPANVHARMNQGITFYELEMYDEAIENFDLALQFDQMRCGSGKSATERSIAGHIYAQRGRASHLAGDWNYAVADYRRALTTLVPTSSPLDVSHRLRLQVEDWLADLLDPLPETQA